MTVDPDEAAIRRWLADYLVNTVGCNRDDVGFDVSMHHLGVASADAVVLAGELSELLGRHVSPVEFWQNPTINGLARYLTAPDTEFLSGTAEDDDRVLMNEPIAVVGLGCRFPGGISGPESFWQFLCEGRSAVTQVPLDRWAAFDDGSAAVAEALSGTTRWGSFLSDVDAFDSEFFEIPPREAARMDPQQRLLLEVAHEALEHAGIPADSLQHTPTGVFVGACNTEYGYLGMTDLSQIDAWFGTGGALSIIANRVSYFFDLRGPSVTVDTACSSSLVAIHLACQSLRTGDSNLALAAGVNVLLTPVVTRSFDQAALMSPTGQCHSFDARADGFVRGEGCAMAVLKRLPDAVRDGNRVLALIRGSAVNQDGRSNGLMAPNPEAQMAVLRAAYANAGVPPAEVGYVEAHGTGTLLGDPIEARALGRVMGRGRPDNSPLLIGSVKSNLGHLEAAAGIAGFLKAVLAVQHGRVPGTLDFQTPNPHIPFEELRIKVDAHANDWPVTSQRRRAGVSSFGFGGTNAHVVLEQAPPAEQVAIAPQPVVSTLVISGRTQERIASIAEMLANWMDGAGAEVSLGEVAHTLNYHRSQHAGFASVCARDRARAVAALRALASGQPAPGLVGPHDGSCGPGTVFVYPGQSRGWQGMGRQLLSDEPAFAAAVAELEPMFFDQNGFSLQHVLAAGEPLHGDARGQSVMLAFQLALTQLWQTYGVEPDAVIGHATGEIAAAVVAGALTVTEGMRVISTRAQLAEREADPDRMLAELASELTDLTPKRPKVPIISAVSTTPSLDLMEWAANMSAPTRFSQAVTAAAVDHTTFVEVSPDPVLARDIIENLQPGTHHHVIGTLERDGDDTVSFHSNFNRTHTTQPPPTPHPPEPHVVLPPSPWHHTRHWLPAPQALSDRASVVLVFPGQGSQWVGMGARLYGESAVFAEQMDLCGEALAGWVDWSLMDVVRGVEGAPGLDRVDVVQPVLWAVMVSLARLWRSVGVVVGGVIGHSQGEIAAACVGGGLSLQDAAAVVALRSRLLVSLSGGGAMVSVGAGVERVEQWLGLWGDRLGVAAVNGSGAVVVSGEVSAAQELIAQCEGAGVWARRIDVDYASHSVQVEAIESALVEALGGIAPRSSSVEFFSSVTGEVMDTAGLDGRYWYRGIRQPVRFDRAVRAAWKQGYRVFVECSPHPVLVAAVEDVVSECAGGSAGVVVPTLGRDNGGLDRFWRSVGQVFSAGAGVDWSAASADSGGRHVPLPTVLGAADGGLLGVGRAEHGLLGAVVDQPDSGGVVLTGRLSLQTHRWLADHAVCGVVVLPGAGFVELVLRAAEQVGAAVVAELTLQAPLVLPAQGAVAVQVVVGGAEASGQRSVSVYGRVEDGDTGLRVGSAGGWVMHARGRLAVAAVGGAQPLSPWPPPGAVGVDVSGAYERLAARGYDYGPAFRGLQAVWRRGAEVFAEVAVDSDGVGVCGDGCSSGAARCCVARGDGGRRRR